MLCHSVSGGVSAELGAKPYHYYWVKALVRFREALKVINLELYLVKQSEPRLETRDKGAHLQSTLIKSNSMCLTKALALTNKLRIVLTTIKLSIRRDCRKLNSP